MGRELGRKKNKVRSDVGWREQGRCFLPVFVFVFLILKTFPSQEDRMY